MEIPILGSLSPFPAGSPVSLSYSSIEVTSQTEFLLISCSDKTQNCTFNQPPMWGYKGLDVKPGYTMEKLGGGNKKLTTKQLPGSIIAYCHYGSWIWMGLGTVGPDSLTIINVSPNINDSTTYGHMLYKKL